MYQAHKQPSWLHTYTKSSHKRDPSYLQDIRFSSWNRWALLKYATATLQTTKYKSMKFYSKLATLYFLKRMCNQTNHSRFHITLLLLARWNDIGVAAPHSATNQGFESNRQAVPGQEVLISLCKFFLHFKNYKSFNSYSI